MVNGRISVAEALISVEYFTIEGYVRLGKWFSRDTLAEKSARTIDTSM